MHRPNGPTPREKRAGKKKRGSDMANPIDYAEPSVPRVPAPLWQRVVAWSLLVIAFALILYVVLLVSGIHEVLFMSN